jgi:predicted dehydrogenase
MSEKRVGIAGYSLAGRFFHSPLVTSVAGLRLTHVVTRSPERAGFAVSDHPGVTVVDSVERLWGEIDLLVVASPNSTHIPLAQEAIDHGVALVVDKPLAVDSASAASLGARAAAAGVPLSVFHNRRWDAEMLTLRRLLNEGGLGTVLRFESRFERWRPEAPAAGWRAQPASEGGGLLLDLGSHLVDQALQLFGPVASVYAEVATVRPGFDSEDDAFMALTHASGEISHLHVSAMTAAPGPRMRVLGTRGAFLVEDLDGQEAALRSGLRPGGADWGLPPASSWGRLVRGEESDPVPSEPGDWPAFYRAMEIALRGAGVVPVPAQDAVAVLRVLEAARQSAESGTRMALP